MWKGKLPGLLVKKILSTFCITKILFKYEFPHYWNSVQRVHCGCIVSASAPTLLDRTGPEPSLIKYLVYASKFFENIYIQI